jgi:hypothetical protein
MRTLTALATALLLIPTVALAQPIVVNEDAKLTAFDAAAGSFFGISVAVSGDTIVVGAQSDDEAADQAGAGYVFVGGGSLWSDQAKLTASDAAAIDHLGEAVAISGDTAVLGAPADDDVAGESGSAYVFVRSGTTWSEQAKLTASDPIRLHLFGAAVTISGDTIVVGAPNDGDGGRWAGAAYVFVRNGTTWNEQANLTASSPNEEAFFGVSVAIAGNTIVVGAPGDDSAADQAGAAYVFTRSGSTWSEQARLAASDAMAGDEFGGAVAISEESIVVGGLFFINAAYVFVRNGTAWSEQAILTGSDTVSPDNFGSSVAISEDTAVIGAKTDDFRGSAYVFVRSGSVWSEQAKLKASDAGNDDFFGNAVALAGRTAVVGAVNDDDAGRESGSAYVFVLPSPRVDLDIKPGNDLNPINPASRGVIPVAILGSDTFDVADVDPPERPAREGRQP